jgi:Big-like domain-containing protein/hemolysin type calcium-binding protein
MDRFLLSCVVLLVMLAAAPAASGQSVTTLYSSIDGERTVSGVDSVPVGPSELGHFRAAMAFTPTKSGAAQLISLKQRCVIPYPQNTVCYGIGEVSIQEDENGRPSGRSLGTSGFYITDALSTQQSVVISGNPTGGSFRFKYPWHTVEGLFSERIPVADASAQAVSEALNAMPGIQAVGGVGVRGGPLPSRPVGIFFNSPTARPHMLDAFEDPLDPFTGGTVPRIEISGQPVRDSCGTLTPAPQLTAGRKYWAVVTSDDAIGWDDWTNDEAEVLEGIDDGPWRPAFNRKTLALKIDSGVNECVAVAVTTPEPGTELGGMYVRAGARRFAPPIELESKGVVPLAWSGASFSGPHAGLFSVLDASHQPFEFARPRMIGLNSKVQLNVACTGTEQDGIYRSTLTLETNDPDKRTIEFPVQCVVDNTPPTLSLAQPQPDGRDGWFVTPPAVTVTASDPLPGSGVVSTSCTRGDQASAAMGGTLEISLTGQGADDLRCAADDLAGNVADTIAWPFKVDTRAPVAEPVYEPARNANGWSNAATTVRFECGDAEPGSGVDAPATGGGSLEAETEGTDFTSAGCTDVAGNASTPTTATVRIDMTPPVIRPAGVMPAPNAAGWNRTDVTVTFECADTGHVQSGVVTDTLADVVVTDESDGAAIESEGTCADAADNRAEGARQLVKIDRTDPETTLDRGPSAATADSGAVLEFGGRDDRSGLAGFECRLDDAAYAACTSPVRLDGLADGGHTFRVRAVDVAGNTEATPAEHTWTLDTVAPETEILSGPDALTASQAASFTHRGDPLGGTAIAGYECRLDDAAWGDCRDYSELADGEHRFQVRARDMAGNADGTPAAWTWTVDTTAPATTITAKPGAQTTETGARFAFGANDDARFECRLDGAPFAPCTSEAAYADLEDGRHTFEVRAIDAIGNVERDPAAFSWEIGRVFAIDDGAATREDTPMTIDVGANDVRTGPLTIAADRTSHAGGTISLAGGESLRYVPPTDFSGTDTFAYTASRDGDTAAGLVTVTVEAVDDPPAFTRGVEVTVDEDSGAYRAAWASGIGAGPAERQSVRFAVGEPSNPGLFSVAPAISPEGELSFTPAPNANGSATVGVRLVDDGGQAASSELAITVRPVDDAPAVTVARDLRCGRSENGTFRLLVHDIDSDGSTLTVSGSASSDRVGLAFGGDGTERTVSITRKPGLRRATVTLRVADGAYAFETSIGLAVGTAGSDRIRGSAGTDLLFGLGGRDAIAGRGGDDLICGGTGSDALHGGAGDDVEIGGRGDDLLRGGAGNDVVRGDGGADSLFGGVGDDILRGGPRGDLFAPAPGADTLVDFDARKGDRR